MRHSFVVSLALLLAPGCAAFVPPPLPQDAGPDYVPVPDLAAPGTPDMAVTPPGDLAMSGPPDLWRGPAPDLSQMMAPDLMPAGYSYPRINEVVPGGSGNPGDEFIELIGANVDTPLNGYNLMRQNTVGTMSPLFGFPDGKVLKAGQYMVIAADNGIYAGMADFTYLGGIGGQLPLTAGAVALFDGDGKQVDGLGWGTAKGGYVEGTAAPSPGTESCSRIPDGVDTNNNRVDARTASITPGAANSL